MHTLSVMTAGDPLLQFDGNLLDGLEFCSKVYALFEEIRDSDNGTTRLRMRPSQVEKRLLEELLPICRYVQASYRLGRYISVRWINGSQSYDAELVQRGAYVCENYYPAASYIEVTCAMHPNEYLSRELLETKGGGFGLDGIRRLKSGEIESVPVSYENMSFVDSYSKILLERISKKSEMHYPENTTLIVQCTLNMPYMPNEWDALMAIIEKELPQSPFREIYIYENTICQYSKSFYPKPRHTT
jgi:hypothetical protein